MALFFCVDTNFCSRYNWFCYLYIGGYVKAPVIYKIINTTNGKFYVGSTNNQYERFRSHRKMLRSGKHHCKHLQAAWNKYGEEAFTFTVVKKVANVGELHATENVWLEKHVGKDYCYNKSKYSDAPMRGVYGADHHSFGVPVSAEQKADISRTLKEFYALAPENHPRYGKAHSEESKAKMSVSRMGKMAGEAHYRYGQTLSAEVRGKIGDTQRGVKKGTRVYTPEGLARAQENMRRHAVTHIPKDWSAVYAKFPAEVQTRYNFSQAVYTGALLRITGVVCLHHGEFSQYAARFRKGAGCPECGGVIRATKKKQEMLKKWADPAFRSETIAAQNKGKKHLDATASEV